MNLTETDTIEFVRLNFSEEKSTNRFTLNIKNVGIGTIKEEVVVFSVKCSKTEYKKVTTGEFTIRIGHFIYSGDIFHTKYCASEERLEFSMYVYNRELP